MTLNAKKTLSLFLVLLGALAILPVEVNAQTEDAVQVGFFEDYEIQPDGRIEVPVEVRGATDLYAVDIQIRFDPALLTVEDANPNLPGVQPALGTFLDAGLTLYNEVDNETGLVNFVMTQVNPSEAKSGDGILLVLYFRSIAEGISDLQVVKVELADRTGLGIPAEGKDASLRVADDVEEQESTPIPVQDPTGIIPIPTQEPTEPPTPTIEPTIAPTATEETTVLATDTPDEPESPAGAEVDSGDSEQAEDGFSLVNYWWVVLMVLLVAVALTVYLQRSKKI